MSWLQKLHATYEVCAEFPDFVDPPQDDGKKEVPGLMPVSHVSQQAHIHIILDGDGNFLDAELFPLKKQVVIPATEDSAGRTSGDSAHPLADKIHYCAKDYKGTKKNLYHLYEPQLKAWCDSPHSHPKACAVYAYVSRGKVVEDLLRKGILHADAEGELRTQPGDDDGGNSIFKRLAAKKVDGVSIRDQGEALVAWSVQISGEREPRTWKDATLQRAWATYDAAQMQQKGLCMLGGVDSSITVKHPRNIRRPGDGAKLISANDSAGFTFRGRFMEPEEACTIGYEASHKAHNALRWLIARQGYRNGEQVVLAWAAKGVDVPNPADYQPPEEVDFFEEEPAVPPDNTVTDFRAETEQEETAHMDVGQEFSRRLAKSIRGYKSRLDTTDGIAVLALDAAGPGRLSVTFYREQMAYEYLDRLQKWQEDTAWILPVRKRNVQDPEAKPTVVFTPCAPLPEIVAGAAYGRRVDDNLLKATVERLLPCIVDGTPIPRDLVESCVRRACNRVGLEEWEWPVVLGVACSMYKGFYARYPQQEKRRTYSMALDRERITRDYLYGRLLAVAEYAERSALDKAGEKRPTNAERLMQRFADNPCGTWLTIEKQLSPYMQRMQSYEPSPYIRIKKELQEIFDKCISVDDFTSSKRLDGEFLLGYHCQLADFYKKKDTASSAQKGDE